MLKKFEKSVNKEKFWIVILSKKDEKSDDIIILF